MANFIDTRGGGQNLLSDMMDRRPMPRPGPRPGGQLMGGLGSMLGGSGSGSGGGGISPRLDELGNNVSSAEEELNAINQRLDSADSKLGGGNGGLKSVGGMQTNFGPQPINKIHHSFSLFRSRGQEDQGGFSNQPEGGFNNRAFAADGGLMELMGRTELTAGAPDITYSGDEGPKAPKEMEEMQMAQIKKIYFELIADGMNPKDAEIKAKEIYSKMSSNVTSSGNESGTMDEGTMDEGIESMMQEPRTMAAEGGIMQGGVKNYLGKQETISNVPVKWKSAPNHPQTELAYITKAEKDLLLKKDLHDSLDGGPNRGPGGLMSLNGWGDKNEDGSSNTDSSNAGGGGADSTTGSDNDTYGSTDQGTGDYQVNDQKAQDEYDENRKKREEEAAAKEKAKEKAKSDAKKAKEKALEDQRAREFEESQKKDKEAAEKKSILDRVNDYNKNYKEKQRQRYATTKIDELNSKLGTLGLDFFGDTTETYGDFIDQYAPSITDFGPKGTGKYSQDFVDDVLSGKRKPPESFQEVNFPGITGGIANTIGPKMSGPTTKEELMDLYSGGINSYKGIRDIDVDDYTGNEMMEIFEPKRYEREYGNEGGEDYVPPIIPAKKEEEAAEEEEPFQLGLAFRADGGRVGKAYGGSMGDDGRRAYGLGSIFKKIKKVFKSPLGKAALLGLGGYGLAGGLGKSSFMQGLKSQGLSGLLKKAGSYALKNPGVIIPAASAAAALFTEEEDDDDYVDNTGIDVKKIRENPYKYLPRAMRAEGGPMGGEFMEGESEELLDMNGMEKDYREDGGFVPLGEYEKKDDVPARLSKNEFVFTADAVRGAGEGDVDLGAEKLYTQMKELESVGKRMQGANEMFQTSQRLEEVI